MSLERVPQGPARRRFLKLLGLVGMSSALPPVMALAQTAAPRDSAGSQAKPPAPTAPSETKISEDAKALAAIIERRYGQHLDATQLEAVTREIENRLQGGQALRARKLANHDEPDAVFRA